MFFSLILINYIESITNLNKIYNINIIINKIYNKYIINIYKTYIKYNKAYVHKDI